MLLNLLTEETGNALGIANCTLSRVSDRVARLCHLELLGGNVADLCCTEINGGFRVDLVDSLQKNSCLN